VSIPSPRVAMYFRKKCRWFQSTCHIPSTRG
jgi:hypothetical protein